MIVVNNNSGIGNRLKNIVTALRRAERKGDGLLINFPHQDFFTVDYQPNPETIKQEIEICTTWSLELFEDEITRGFLKEPKVLKIYHDYDTTFELTNSIDFHFNNISTYLVEDLKKHFKRIEFASIVTDTVEAYVLKHDLSDVVGVHIRSWSDDAGRHARLHDLSLFTQIMKDLPGERFFVATDSLRVLKELAAQFPNRIIASPRPEERHISKNLSLQAMFASLADMLLLSRCRRIVGTYSSTFTEVAWWLGGAQSVVAIPIPKACR
jgi:hypothetical protein